MKKRWTDVERPQKKKALSIRIDEDVLAFFKKAGPGYQGYMNAVLRSYMEHARKDGARSTKRAR